MNSSTARSGTDSVAIGEWIVDRSTNTITRDGIRRSVQPLSVDILLYLAERAGNVVTSDELIEAFWAGRHVADDAVYRRIADLRKQLNDSAREPRYIETISKRGYRLIATVRPAPRIPAPAASRPRRKRLRYAAIAVIVLMVMVATMVAIERRPVDTALLQEAEALIARDRYQEAYLALQRVSARRDGEARILVDRLLLPVTVYTRPAGVAVAYQFAEVGSD